MDIRTLNILVYKMRFPIPLKNDTVQVAEEYINEYQHCVELFTLRSDSRTTLCLITQMTRQISFCCSNFK